jgi:hypothetical protein
MMDIAYNDAFDDSGFSLLRLVPPVLRAREFRLYTQGGGRLVDLWQNGGAAALGHTPPALLRELKNSASRGLYAPFPHPQEKRLEKALSQLFPGRVCKIYAAGTSLPSVLETAGVPFPWGTAYHDGDRRVVQADSLSDPSMGHKMGPWVSLWRPFPDPAAPLALFPDAPPVLIPVLPGTSALRTGFYRELTPSWPQSPGIAMIDPAFEKDHPFPPSDLLPPVLLALITRGIYDLIAASPRRADPSFPRLKKALSAGQWRRKGIYLSPPEAPGRDVWSALFRRFLEGGFLLPPDPGQPLILPGALSPGEEAKLAKLLAQTLEI